MSRFASQLKTLIATMEAVQETQSFDMTNWHEEQPRDIVDCGFVACICGHQAGYGRTEFFDVDVNDGFRNAASDISEELDAACSAVFDDEYLADSIYGGDQFERWRSAKRSGLFTCTQRNHPHLNRDKPTIKQTISFIKLCLKKVKAVK